MKPRCAKACMNEHTHTHTHTAVQCEASSDQSQNVCSCTYVHPFRFVVRERSKKNTSSPCFYLLGASEIRWGASVRLTMWIVLSLWVLFLLFLCNRLVNWLCFIFQAETATVCIPELDFEVQSGTLGGRFTTVEGLLRQLSNQLKESNPFSLGDSASDTRLNEFLGRLAEVVCALSCEPHHNVNANVIATL